MIRVDIDSQRATAMLGHIVARGQRLPMGRLQTLAYRSVLRNFGEQGRPTKWKPLAESTKDSRDSSRRAGKLKGKKRRKKWVGTGAVPGKIDRDTGAYMFKGYDILQDNGALKKSIQSTLVGDHAFMVYTNLHSEPSAKYPGGYYYPSVHQFGTKPGSKRNIPARPFMVWQEDDLREIRRIVIHHIVGGAA